MLLQISGQEWRYYALRFGRLIIAEIETKAGEGSAIFTVGDGEQETREIVEFRWVEIGKIRTLVRKLCENFSEV